MTKYLLTLFILFTVLAQSQEDPYLKSLDTIASPQEKLDALGSQIVRLVYSNPENAAVYARIYDSISKQAPTPENQAHAFNYKGMASHASQEYEVAIKQYLDAVRIIEANNSDERLAQVYNNLAASYNIRGDAAKTEEYFLKAEAVALRRNDSLWVASVNSNLGVHYNSHQQYEKAELAFKKSLPYFENKKDSINAGVTYMNMGNAQLPLDKSNAAMASYKRSMQLIPYKKYPIIHSVAEAGIGIALTQQKKYAQALPYLKRGNDIAKTIGHTEQVMETNNALAEYYAETRNFEEAFKLSVASQNLKDSVLTATQDKNMADAMIEFETEKKDAQLQVLALEKDKAEQGKIMFTVLAASGALIAGLIGFFLYRNKKKNTLLAKQKSMLEKTLDEKNILLKETHHRVKNSFQMVSSLLQYQAQTAKEKEAKIAIKEAQNRVRSMVLIHQKLYSKDQLVGIDSKEYIEDFTEDVIRSNEFSDQKLRYQLDLESHVLDIETITPIGLILNELLTNVLKHAFPEVTKHSQVTITFLRVESNLILKVTDNGVGMADQVHENSFGLKLIETLAKKLKGELIIEKNEPSGTTAILTMRRFTVL